MNLKHITQENLVEYNHHFASLSAEEILELTLKNSKGKVAVLSSFGSYSALLLKLIADVKNSAPIIFLETEKHFPETLKYVEDITKLLGLKNLISLKPDKRLKQNIDADGTLWSKNVNRCCWLRKVEPLERHLKEANYDAVITGRRRYQTKERQALEPLEIDSTGQVKLNPFFALNKEDITKKFEALKLPQHPLVEKGYLSIGCAPCTFPVKEGEDERSGRWANTAGLSGEGTNDGQKQECGIHLN